MTIIEFPFKSQRYLQLGQEALAQGNVVEALNNFCLAYDKEASFPLNQLIVHLMMEEGRYQDALELTKEWQSHYLIEKKYFSTYIELLIHNHHFLEARKYIRQFERAHDENEFSELLKLQVLEAEDYAQRYQKQKIQHFLLELQAIESLKTMEQFALIQQMSNLPLEKYLEVAEQVLSNTKVHYLARTKVIEELVQLGSQKVFLMYWFNDQQKKIDPSKLNLPKNDPIYLKVRQEIDFLLENQNPSLLTEIKQELILHFAVLYPFARDFVQDERAWAASYLLDYAPELYLSPIPTEVQLTDIQEKKRQIRLFLLKLS